MTRLVLAVDGGNSKADVAIVDDAGRLHAAVRGPSISHQAVGLEAGMATLDRLVHAARAAAGLGASAEVDGATLGLAGADFASDLRTLRGAISSLGIAREVEVTNDTYIALRAGTDRRWGVVLICGRGSNGAAVAPGGRRVRFDGVGLYSGDWGGGTSLGWAAVAAAVRGRDGRGPRTALERAVPERFGLRTPAALTRGLYEGRIGGESAITDLAPLVFETALGGDEVARGIVDHLADELVTMAVALLRRLRMTRLETDVVLAGGVFRTEDEAFYERIRQGIAAVAPKARVVRLAAPPVLGAALLALDGGWARRGTSPEIQSRLRAALRAWDATVAGAKPAQACRGSGRVPAASRSR